MNFIVYLHPLALAPCHSSDDLTAEWQLLAEKENHPGEWCDQATASWLGKVNSLVVSFSGHFPAGLAEKLCVQTAGNGGFSYAGLELILAVTCKGAEDTSGPYGQQGHWVPRSSPR